MKTNSNKIGIAARLLRAGAIAAIIFSMAACDTGFQHVNKPGQNPGTGAAGAGGEYFYDENRHNYDPAPVLLSGSQYTSHFVDSDSNIWAVRMDYSYWSNNPTPFGQTYVNEPFNPGNPAHYALHSSSSWTPVGTPANETTNGTESAACDVCATSMGTRIAYARGTAGLVINSSGVVTDFTGVGPSTTVNIPAYYLDPASGEYVPVTEVGTDAFKTKTNISSIAVLSDLLPNPSFKLETIGAGAFEGTAFTSFTIPGSVATIGAEAFADSGLTSISIPASVTSIGDGAFGGSSNLATITSASANFTATNNILKNSSG